MQPSILQESNPPEITPYLVDITQAATLLNMGKTFIRAEVKAGRLVHVRMGNRMKFKPEDLRRYIEARLVTTDQQQTAIMNDRHTSIDQIEPS